MVRAGYRTGGRPDGKTEGWEDCRRLSGRTVGQEDGRATEREDGWTETQKDERATEQNDGQTGMRGGGRTTEREDGRTGTQEDEWATERKDGRTGIREDGRGTERGGGWTGTQEYERATEREDGRTIALATSKLFVGSIALYAHTCSLVDISPCCGYLLRRSMPHPSPSLSLLGRGCAASGMRPRFTFMFAHCG